MQVDLSHIPDPEVLRAANISPDTLLATDFLNHYNEVAMLMDFLGDDEEIDDEILAWKPEGYVDHFAHSGFRDKELAIEAYSYADPQLIARFSQACRTLDEKILEIQSDIKAQQIDSARTAGKTLFDDIAVLNVLIVGSKSESLEDQPCDAGISQSDIDNLFG